VIVPHTRLRLSVTMNCFLRVPTFSKLMFAAGAARAGDEERPLARRVLRGRDIAR
jgi:hypothetical protein